MKFDKSKILTVVTADQAKVGQKGWFASNVETLSRFVLEEQPKELLGFDGNNAVHAFKTAFQNHALFYPAPEPTYAERQAEWIRTHNLKEGDKVKVLRTAKDREDGWCNSWVQPMTNMVGGVFTYVRTSGDGIRLSCGYEWPYFVLEVVKEPTYRPYKNAEEFKPYRDEWFRVKHDGGMLRICAYNDKGVQGANGRLTTYQIFFEKAEHENGEPCGVREES